MIDIDPPTAESKRLWAKALELAQAFGAHERWTLIGGLMVQLHAFEHGSGSRLTSDIDFLGDSRRRPSMTERIAEQLIERGGEMAMPPRSDEKIGYRFDLDGEVIEILGSDGVRDDPQTLSGYTTFQVPGGTQALARTEVVGVSLADGDPVRIRRPSLLGAILVKARVLAKERDKFESDRQDLLRLLGFVQDPRALARSEGLRKSERKWLRSVEALLAFDDLALAGVFDRDELTRAEQAYRLLLA